MLATFSRELAEHREEVRTMFHEHAVHVDDLLAENERLRQENARLETLLAERSTDRPSVAIQIGKTSERPSLRALLTPTSTAGWVLRMGTVSLMGLGVGFALLVWRFLVK